MGDESGFSDKMLVVMRGGAVKPFSAVRSRDVLANGAVVKAVAKSLTKQPFYQVTRSTGVFLECTMHGQSLRTSQVSSFADAARDDYSTIFTLPFRCAQSARVYVGYEACMVRRTVAVAVILPALASPSHVYRLVLEDADADYFVRHAECAVILSAKQ